MPPKAKFSTSTQTKKNRAAPSFFRKKRRMNMEDDIARVAPMEPLRELTKALVDTCKDAGLLDLVYKILLNA